MNRLLILNTILISAALIISACKSLSESEISENSAKDTIIVNQKANGVEMEISFEKGSSFNHPSFVFWLEDLEGNYIQTVFVTEYVSTGIFGNADAGDGSWKAEKGESIRPAALPYWSHKRNIISRDSIYMPTPEKPVADAYSGATPKTNFILKTKSDNKTETKFRLLMEINQTWDWNEYWHNNKYPDDQDYKSSCQPSLIYSTTIDLSKDKDYYLNPIGHGHYSGDNGELYGDISKHTTALDIVKRVKVKIKN